MMPNGHIMWTVQPNARAGLEAQRVTPAAARIKERCKPDNANLVLRHGALQLLPD